MTPRAQIRHRLPRRARLRIPDMRGDAAYFAALEEWLGALEAVESVRADPRTGGVLIRHAESALDTLAARAEAEGRFRLAPQEQPSASMDEVLARLRGIDARLNSASRGEVDLRAALFLVLLALAARQTLQGQVMAPAITLLWYARDLLKQEPVPG
ncbi:HMA2 domain-containing protein [Thiohalorhabdus methylotrophus]|uniref:HMA2 domain-containing protein n=1 Tax=Thiohalorhabdus methylotrophus TaxID=3242694 RepID=A0ABV4TSQ6_9GAMM